MIGFARAASPDMLFAGLLTASMAVAVEMLQKERPGAILRIAFGFFLGAAVLAKGPAAVILAGGATLLWAALAKHWTAAFRFLHPLVIVVFCATSLPWYVLCALRNPDFLRVFIWQHNFERFLTPVFQHPQPFWFFGAILFLGVLPWLPLAACAFDGTDMRKAFTSSHNSPALFLGTWSLFTLVFFSASQSKLPGYILPAIPPSMLLLAASFAHQVRQKKRGLRLTLASVGLVFPVLVVVARLKLIAAPGPRYFSILDPGPISGVIPAAVAALAGASLVAGFSLYRKWLAAVCVSAAIAVALVLIANLGVLPELDALLSARSDSFSLTRTYEVKPEEVAVYRLPRAYQYSLDYYFGRELPEWTSGNRGASFLIFNAKSDMFDRLRAANLDASPAPNDAQIWWAWRKERPKHPFVQFGNQ
jgi:4-amino-4-deoxy-L-arabinose transferase-like glycosyltransferase